MNKTISILLGAGFSKSVANLPLASSISESIKLAIQNNKIIKDAKFKDLLINDPENLPWSYEKCSDFLYNLGVCLKNKERASVILENSRRENIIQAINVVDEIVYETTLVQLNKISMDKKFKKRRSAFLEFINLLLGDGYDLHIFDLNHDMAIEQIIGSTTEQYQNFFKHYEPRPYAINVEVAKQKQRVLHFLEYQDDLMHKKNKIRLGHYKLHGALNITYLEGFPFKRGENSVHDATGPHLICCYDDKNKLDYGTTSIKALLKITREGIYQSPWYGKRRLSSSLLNQGHAKGQILTKDFVRYFPDCYAKFAQMGEEGASLLTLGYGFYDNHINHIIQRHYDTTIYEAYQVDQNAKLLFSGIKESEIINKGFENIKIENDSFSKNNYKRKIIHSSKKLEDFLREFQ